MRAKCRVIPGSRDSGGHVTAGRNSWSSGHGCYRLDIAIPLDVCVPHTQIPMLKLIPNMLVFLAVVFGKCLAHEGRALMSAISALTKETTENSLVTSAM